MSEEKNVRVTIDPTGGLGEGCLGLVGFLVGAVILFAIAESIWKWLTDIWWVLAVIAAVTSLVWSVGYYLRSQEEARQAEASREHERLENRRREADRLARESEEAARRKKLADHQALMNVDEQYAMACQERMKRIMVAELFDLDLSNPYIDRKVGKIDDAEAWERAFYTVPDGSPPVPNPTRGL